MSNQTTRPDSAAGPPSEPGARALLFHTAVVADLLDGLLDEHLSGARLTPREFEIATVLRTRGPLPPGEIAVVTGVPPPSVSRLVARMEAAGLVKLRGHPTDRRSRIVSLTGSGRKAFADAQVRFNRLYGLVADALGPGVESAAAAVRRLEWALRVAAGVPSPDPLPPADGDEPVLRYPPPALALDQEAEALEYIAWLRARAARPGRRGP